MKYFKPELWVAMSSADPLRRARAEELWNRASKAYYEYFETVKPLLPPELVDRYLTCQGFHDVPIARIVIENAGANNGGISLHLANKQLWVKIEYRNVSSYRLCVPKARDRSAGAMHWGYDEFEWMPDCGWNHRILCDLDCEIDMICAEIRIVEE